MISSSIISVLVAEDHSVVRQGLCSLLKTDGGFSILGEAKNGREAVALARDLKPDVVLMDVAMPELNGLEAARQIFEFSPRARILILSAHGDDEYVRRAVDAGVAGFLEKQTSAELLTKALREVAAGGSYFSPRIARRMRDAAARPRDRDGLHRVEGDRLTRREAEVLQLVAEGFANKQIAVALGISMKTVEKHRQHLMDKLNIYHTAGLTRHAIATGVIENSVQRTTADPA